LLFWDEEGRAGSYREAACASAIGRYRIGIDQAAACSRPDSISRAERALLSAYVFSDFSGEVVFHLRFVCAVAGTYGRSDASEDKRSILAWRLSSRHTLAVPTLQFPDACLQPAVFPLKKEGPSCRKKRLNSPVRDPFPPAPSFAGHAQAKGGPPYFKPGIGRAGTPAPNPTVKAKEVEE